MTTSTLLPQPPDSLAEAFRTQFDEMPDFYVRAPGRVDLVGTHTDYNDGWVLPVAIDKAAWLAVRAIDQPLMRLHAHDLGESVTIPLMELEERHTDKGMPLPGWAAYPAGVAWSMLTAHFPIAGMQAVLTSEVPMGAGMSSSAAVEVAYALAMTQICNWPVDRMQLALLCKQAENDYVGVSSGLMDQFASLHGKADHALLLDCRTHDWEALPISTEVSLVVADTSTRRELTGSAYNERRSECDQAVAALAEHVPAIRALRDASLDDLIRYGDGMPAKARMRAEHVINENSRVLTAAEKLRSMDMNTLGAIMDESHVSSRELFEASSQVLDTMWEAGREHPACLGGRFIGAGWAGNLIFLVQRERVKEFISHTDLRFREKSGLTPTFYPMQAGPGARVIPAKREQ